MGSFVRDDSVTGRDASFSGTETFADTTLTGAEHTVLASAIRAREPAEIRRLQEDQPELVREWVSLLKAQQLADPARAEELGAALNHIRLCTLSPLKFAAE